MEIEPVAPPSLPLSVKVVGGVAVAVAGILILRWLIGTLLFLIQAGLVIAIIVGVIWAASKFFGSDDDNV